MANNKLKFMKIKFRLFNEDVIVNQDETPSPPEINPPEGPVIKKP